MVLRVQIHKLRVQIYKLQVQIHEFRVWIHELRIQIHELQVQIHQPQFQIHELRVASVIQTRLGKISNHKICKFLQQLFFSTYIKISSQREIENLKEIENLEIVIERHRKAIEKLQIERMNKIKWLKELEATKRIRRTNNWKNKWNNNFTIFSR